MSEPERLAHTLRQRALASLARREYGRPELRRKLLTWLNRQPKDDEAPFGAPVTLPDPGTLIDTVLDGLQASGWLDDARFVASKVRQRENGRGLRRIEQELQQLGQSLDAEQRSALQSTELERAHALWSRRYDGPPSDERERARQSRFLLSRGFGMDTLRALWSGWQPDENTDTPDLRF